MTMEILNKIIITKIICLRGRYSKLIIISVMTVRFIFIIFALNNMCILYKHRFLLLKFSNSRAHRARSIAKDQLQLSE